MVSASMTLGAEGSQWSRSGEELVEEECDMLVTE